MVAHTLRMFSATLLAPGSRKTRSNKRGGLDSVGRHFHHIQGARAKLKPFLSTNVGAKGICKVLSIALT